VKNLIEAGKVCTYRGKRSYLFIDELESIEKNWQWKSDNGYFIRLDSCSPKDSPLGVGPVFDSRGVIDRIITSSRCVQSLEKGDEPIVILIPWNSEINISNEFRCFFIIRA